jgi:oligopeptide/dipeptide ABC transporter ATP-binding protein
MMENPDKEKKSILRVQNLKKYFIPRGIKGNPIRSLLTSLGFIHKTNDGKTSPKIKAVDGVSFSLDERETLGLVGESGCGKSTLGFLIVRLLKPTEGSIFFKDSPDLVGLEGKRLLPWRRRIQIIFQDPFSSLNPRMTVGSIIGEALSIHHLAKGAQKDQRVREILETIGLKAHHSELFPHEFSGGQRQRIGIARALAVEPQVIIADEPVSALDVSIQAQIINLLMDLQSRLGLSLIFISHDLSVIGHISHRIAVMYLGRIVETGTRKDIFEEPLHPYTEALLAAVPTIDPKSRRKIIVLEGDVSSPMNPPSGCPFHPRCPKRFSDCDKIVPELMDFQNGHKAACLLYRRNP